MSTVLYQARLESHFDWTLSLYYRGKPGTGQFVAIARGPVEWHSAGFRLAEHAVSHARRLVAQYERACGGKGAR